MANACQYRSVECNVDYVSGTIKETQKRSWDRNKRTAKLEKTQAWWLYGGVSELWEGGQIEQAKATLAIVRFYFCSKFYVTFQG